MVFSLTSQTGLGEITSSPPKTETMTILDPTSKTSAEILSMNAAKDAAAALNIEESCGLGGDSDTSIHSGASDNLDLDAKMEESNKKKFEYTKILPVPLDSGSQAYICPICSEKLENAHTLTIHIRNHNSKVPSCHSCTICGKTLCSQSSLDRHMLVHSEAQNGDTEQDIGGGRSLRERPFRCQVCDLSFTTNGNMHRHMRVHEKEFSKSPGSLKALLDASLQPIHGHDSKRARKRRSAGGLNTMVESFMEKRAKTDHTNSIGATDPAKKTVIPSESFDDTKVEDSEKLHCPVCQKTFLSKSGLESHVEASHPGCNIKCQLCHQSFPSISLLTAHHAVYHGKPNLPTMPVGFHELAFADFSSGKFPLIAQQWCEENQRRASSNFHNFECLLCKKAFPSADSLDLHMKVHAKPEYICDVCQLIMPDFDSLKKHKQTVHAARALNFDDPKPEKKEHFLAQLKLHQGKEQIDNEESDCSDEEENDYFKKVAELKRESLKSERRSEENNNSSDFADIQKIIQNANVSALPPLSATPTTAPKVADLFKGKAAVLDESDDEGVPMDYLADDDLSDSLSDITEPSGNATPSKFNCRVCDNHFDNFNALKVHMRIHQGLSPYKCNLCPYSSADKTTLIRHLRTHNGERPFQCKICQYAFTTKANCERHVRKKHNKEGKEDIDEAVGYNQQIEETSSSVDELQTTVCKYCGVDFKFFRALKHHLRSHASCRQKPFTCSVCEIGFSTKANCIRHIQKRHQEIQSHQLEANVKFNIKALDSHNQMSSLQAPPTAHVSKLYQDSSLRHSKFSPPAKMDTPLDFSKKALTESPSAILKTAKKDGHEDGTAPMDLSKPGKEKVSKPTSILPIRPTPVHPAFNLPFMLTPDLLKTPLNADLLNPLFHHSKVFKCPYCHLQFNQESKLHLHMKMHASSRPFQCSFCPAGFTVKSNLDIHIRTRHDNGNPPFTPARNRFISNNIKLVNNNLGMTVPTGLGKRMSPFMPSSILPSKYPTVVGSMVKNTEDDLASVSKLLDTTAQDTLQSLKLMQPTNESSFTDLAKEAVKDDKEMVIMEDGQIIEIKKEENQRRDDASTDSGLSPDKTPRKKRNSYANAPNRVSCPYCSRTFPWISSLRRHILTHTGQKPYKCPECPVHFSTKSNRERHLLRKHGVNPVNPNTRQIMDRPYKCQLCVFSSFSKPEKLIHHYKTKHPEAEIPTNIHEMSVEMWLTSPNREVFIEEGEDGRLVINEDDYDEDEDEDEDMDESTPEKYSPTPSEAMEEEALMIKAEDSEDEEMEEEMEMENSVGTEERITPEPTSRPLMESYSPSVSPLVRPSPARTTIINPERDNYNVDKILDCWQCGQHYATRKLLLRHLKEHNTDLPFKCYLCDASYLTRKECLDHKAVRHPDDWLILKNRNKVENIDEFVVTMERLSEVADEEGANNARIKEVRIGNSDEMTIMAAERKVFCTLCPKKFWSLQDLRRHMRSHTGEKPFECDICGRYFTLKHSMMRHRRKHTDADIRPFKSHRTSMIDGQNDASSYLGGESNDDACSPAPDHDQFLGIRERISRTASPSTLSGAPTPVAVATPPVAMPTPVAKDVIPPRSSPAPNSSVMSLGLDSSDILHNLLGVDNSAIDQMLQTGSADAAAKLLGMD